MEKINPLVLTKISDEDVIQKIMPKLHYVRARIDTESIPPPSIVFYFAFISELYKHGYPIAGYENDFMDKNIEDKRGFRGFKFNAINHIWMCDESTLTQGTINYYNKEYQGLELLANKETDIKTQMNNLLSKIFSLENYNNIPEKTYIVSQTIDLNKA